MGSGADTPSPVSDWERQLKGQIRRRYATLKFPPDGAGRAIEAGYPAELIAKTPEWLAASYLGCGFLLGDLRLAGDEIVIDLGCGTGLDSYLLAMELTNAGIVLAIDMTPKILSQVQRISVGNIIPLAGDMERLPLTDELADMVIANASLNLTLDKGKALAEACRILKPGGRLLARDLVKVDELPPEVLSDPLSYNTSLGGALAEEDLVVEIAKAGFKDIAIMDHQPFSYVQSVKIEAVAN